MPVTKVRTRWVDGNFEFYDEATGTAIGTFEADDLNLDVAALSILGVDMTDANTAATLLAAVVAGTASASKAVVLDASKGVTGLGQVGSQKVMTAQAVDGACAIAPKVVMLTKVGVCAVTLADPTSGTDDGTEVTFIAATANAHTVSNAAGSGFFSSGGGSKDVATFGGAIGDRLKVVAYLGKWYITDSLNITLG